MATNATRAVVVDTTAPKKLVIREVPLGPPPPGNVAVRVTAISLNRGETKRALTQSETGWRPGWDFAGVVETAADTGGPPKGARVVGMLPAGAWAQRIHAPVQAVAALPDGVSDAQAATLPVAGLTALHALRQGGLLLSKKVLVDGASGGVGHLAVQLAAASGALVFAHLRRKELSPIVEKWCTGGVVVGPTLEAARAAGPYHLILDSVGGATLASAMTMLATAGTCVTFGVSEAPTSTFESGVFFRTGGAKLYGLILFDELVRTEPASQGLALLAGLVARKVLTPKIDIEMDWSEIGEVAQHLMDRKYPGKAVLRVS